MCSFSYHKTNSCPYYTCHDQPYLASPWDNTDVVLSLRDSSFPLAQCTGLEASEFFGVVARFDVVDACFKSVDFLDEVYDLDKTHLKGLSDVFMHEVSASLGFGNIVLPNPLNHSHVSPICSQPCISLEYSLERPIDNPKICDSNVDLALWITCLICLVEILIIFFP